MPKTNTDAVSERLKSRTILDAVENYLGRNLDSNSASDAEKRAILEAYAAELTVTAHAPETSSEKSARTRQEGEEGKRATVAGPKYPTDGPVVYTKADGEVVVADEKTPPDADIAKTTAPKHKP